MFSYSCDNYKDVLNMFNNNHENHNDANTVQFHCLHILAIM